MLNLLKLMLIAAVAMATASCVFDLLFSGSKTLAEDSVEQFHVRYNGGRFQEIYDGADESFKEVHEPEEFVALLEQTRRKLGAVREKNKFNTKVNKNTNRTEVTLEYNVEYANGKGTEKFEFYIVGDKAKLCSYKVTSPLLASR